MSLVKDSEGNVINRPPEQFQDGKGNVKYSGEHMDTLDWFDTHVAEVEADIKAVEDGIVSEVQMVVNGVASEIHKVVAAVEGVPAEPEAELPTITIVNNGDGTSTMTPSAEDLDAIAGGQEAAQATESVPESEQ